MTPGPKCIFMQAGILIAIGAAIGVVDAFARPIQIGREVPPPLLIPQPKPTKTAPTTPPQPVSPVETAPTPIASTSGSQPDCTITPKDKLPAGHITLDEAKALFDAKVAATPAESGGPGAVFVDTRKKDIFEEGHVVGAYRIGLHDFEGGDPQILNFIDRSSTIIAYCVGGNCDESEAVARMLSGAGYTKVYVMHDGFPCWKKLGYPNETGPGAFP